MSVFKQEKWSPYIVGGLIGVLSWIAFYTADKPLGVSTTFVRGAGMIEKAFAPAHVVANPYYQAEKVRVDWQFMLVIGLLLGSFTSALLSRSAKGEIVPELWRRRFGPSVAKRLVCAFIGGVILLFGARLAGGCTSGHGISGGLQLAISSWVFFASLVVAGVITANILFGRRQL